MIEKNTFTIVWIMIIGLFLITGLFYITMELIFNKTKNKESYKHLKKDHKKINVYRQNKPAIHPALIFVIILAAYSFGYISRNINQIPTGTETINSNLSYNETKETNYPSDSDPKTTKYRITFDISYSDLNEDEKELYDKIISTALNKDNTFITDRELNFILNTTTITENESIRVQSVLYNNYPDVKFYTTRYPNSWMYYVTHCINGMPLYRTYYFNVKYK